MRLPYDLLSKTYKKPDIYLCDVDKSPMCKLNAIGAKGSFKFNAYSELSFETSRTYLDTITGEIRINPFYDKIETPRLIKLDGFGYFEIQGPESTNNGIKESQTVTAYSLEYTLSTKYLENFQINTGATESVEVGYAYDKYYDLYGDDYINYIAPVTLCNDANPKLSLLHLAIEKAYGWKIGHVDASLKTLSRKFEVERQSIYDFLMNEVCEKFNCYIVFDTENNTINVYAESKTAKFIGDGRANQFTISPKFDKVNTVSVDGYKTTKWKYNSSTGVLTLEDVPTSGAHIEVVDGALEEWETDVFVTFENLAQEIKVSYDSDEIKTQLKVTYGEDLDIREINLGVPYLTDLSYYYTPDWMGQDLYDAYTAYLQKSQNSQSIYTDNSQLMVEISNKIEFEEGRLSLDYSIEESVHGETVGTYYVRGGSSPNYYYTEVSLPEEYNANITYYKMNGTNVDISKVNELYRALRKNFKDNTVEDIDDLADSFKFMETYTISYLSKNLSGNKTIEQKRPYVLNFLGEMWNEIGRTPLKSLYQETFKIRQTTNIDWADPNSDDYPWYYVILIFLESIDSAIKIRDNKIAEYNAEYDVPQKANADIVANLAMDKNFTEQQLIRLSAFLKEDELHLDDIIETSDDTLADSFKYKQDAMESGRIELHKICQPRLQFSMTMANIYAIKAFEPIINQFQLGNVIKVGLRKDYIKQSRLLQVDLEFDNLASLSTEFGELTDLRTQSDIHADLLGQAISAGKSVAQNSANWTKGSDTATSTDLRIQNGLLDAATVLKAMDGTQSSEIDKFGIHLRKENPDTGEIDPKQGWLVNNMFAYTDNNWKTTKTVLGEFQLRGEASPRWGLLADAVIAGYVEGSHIIGGDIKIGDIGTNSFPFQVNSDGDMTATSATIKGNSTIAGWNITDKYIDSTVSNTKKRLYLASASDSSTNWICATNSDGANTFYVTKEGKVYAKSGEIGGWAIDSHKISGWDDEDKCFAKMDKSAIGVSGSVVFGVYDGSKWPFYVDGVGVLHATGAIIEGYATDGELSSAISVTNGKIEAEVSRAKGVEGNLSARITVTENGVATSVQKGSVISSINQSAETITINANKISLAGKTISLTSDNIAISSTNFSVTKDGNITAKSGTVANWTISGNTISSTANNYRLRLDSGACGVEGDDWISVYDATNKSWPFYVTGTGQLVASGAIIGGKITATEGSIGGWSIGTDIIRGQSGNYEARMNKGAIGTSGHVVFGVYNGSKWSAYIDGVGKLVASGASIEGHIDATSGTIGGCTISNGVFTAGTIKAGYIEGLDASKIISGQFGNERISWLSADKITAGTLSADRISGGTLTIGKSVNIETSAGARLLSHETGIRIYSNNNYTAFDVDESGVSCFAGTATYLFLEGYPTAGGDGVHINSSYGITINTGTAGYLKGTWYLNNSSTAVTSDENKKNTIVEISEKYNTFFDNIGCYTFKYNEGTSDRLHCGFISQRIKQSLDIANISTKDFGGVVIKYNDDGTEDWYVRYEEFIPLNTWQIQKLKTRVAELEDRLAALEERN